VVEFKCSKRWTSIQIEIVNATSCLCLKPDATHES